MSDHDFYSDREKDLALIFDRDKLIRTRFWVGEIYKNRQLYVKEISAQDPGFMCGGFLAGIRAIAGVTLKVIIVHGDLREMIQDVSGRRGKEAVS